MGATVITVLGMVGHTKMDTVIKEGKITKTFVDKTEEDKAYYSFGKRLVDKYRLKQEKYINMLPLLCELFTAEKIVPVYTTKSKAVQQQVLLYENIESAFLDNQAGYIEDEKDFTAIFEQINTILYKHDKVIVDITHGFRHLPVLAVISLIMENIRDIHKIEHILFAKEVEAFSRYEIIDLKEYLDMANIAFALASFNNNYTIAHQIRCSDPDYQSLIDSLSEFSEHILSNAIIELIEAADSLTERILQMLENIDRESIVGLGYYIRSIKLHLLRIKALKNISKEKQLYAMAKNMYEKGYFLNAITLLNEAVGYYGAACFREYDSGIAKAMDLFLETKSQKVANYELSSQSKTLIKNLEKMNGPYLDMPEGIKLSAGQKSSLQKKKKKIKEQIPSHLLSQIKALNLEIEFKVKHKEQGTSLKALIVQRLKATEGIGRVQELIVDMDNLRNNLAHANSSYAVSEIKEKMKDLLARYAKLCMEENILAKGLQ